MEHFGDFQIDRLRQVAEHLKVLWHILNTEDSGEFRVRSLHCRYTYEYHSRFGGYVYDHDGRLAKQDKSDKKVRQSDNKSGSGTERLPSSIKWRANEKRNAGSRSRSLLTTRGACRSWR